MNSRHAGFTLVEVVVTIALVGMLLAMTFTGLSGARRGALQGRCQSNLRQMITAAQSYALVNGGAFPAALLYEVGSGGISTRAWDFVQEDDGSITPGVLWSYTDQPMEVQQCPGFAGDSNFGADPYTGYNYNTTFIGAEGRYPVPGPDGQILDGWNNVRRGVLPSQWHAPANTVVFADAGYASGANKFMRAPGNTVENNIGMVYAGGQAFRHGDGCCCAWLDGHCSRRTDPHEGVHATQTLLDEIMGYPRNGFLSQDDLLYDPRR